jgi:peptidylamidoglycolate lyase
MVRYSARSITKTIGSGYITIIDENNRVISTPGGTEPVYVNGILQEQKQEGDTFIHPHDVCVDADENLYIPQWNSGKTYPVMLERVEK